MTISVETTKITYQANGSNTTWNFSFPAGPDPNIKLFVTNAGNTTQILTNLQININPVVDPNPTSIGGSVIYPVTGAPLAVGNQVTVIREVPLIQPTSFANQSIIYQEAIETALDYVVEEIQQLQEQIDRTILGPITDTTPIVFPPCPERANKFLAFDENCQAVAIGNANPITSTNGVRVPNTEIIPELPARPLRPGTIITFNSNGDPVLAALPPPNLQPLLGTRVSLTGVHTATNAEKGFLFQLSGNTFYDFALLNPTTYDPDWSCAVFNADIYTGPGTGRAKRILFNGTIMPGGLLWPGQWVYIFRYGTTWVANPTDVRWKPGASPTFFVDPVLGHDDGTSDGLATGTGATKTVNFATGIALARLDYGGLGGIAGGALIQLAQGTYTENVVINRNTLGGLPIVIQGATAGVNPDPWLFNVPTGTRGISIQDGSNAIVRGIRMVAGNASIGIIAINTSNADVSNCNFGAFPNGQMLLAVDGSTMAGRDFNVQGNCVSFIGSRRGSTFKLNGFIITASGLTFNAFFVSYITSSIVAEGFNEGAPQDFFLGGGAGCVGLKYICQIASMIGLGNGVADALPGNQAGVTGTTPAHYAVDGSSTY